MSGIDLVVLGVIVVSALVSFLRGFVREAASLLTWIGAIVVTLMFTSRFATLIPADTISSAAARAAISAAVLFFGTLMIGGLVGWLLSRVTAGGALGVVDRTFGALFGVLRGALIIALLVLLANLVPTLKQESWWRNSLTLPYFQTAARLIHAQLPREIGQYFDFAPATY